jgi:hypothetical protein
MGINEVKQIGEAGIVNTLHGLPVAEVSMGRVRGAEPDEI